MTAVRIIHQYATSCLQHMSLIQSWSGQTVTMAMEDRNQNIMTDNCPSSQLGTPSGVKLDRIIDFSFYFCCVDHSLRSFFILFDTCKARRRHWNIALNILNTYSREVEKRPLRRPMVPLISCYYVKTRLTREGAVPLSELTYHWVTGSNNTGVKQQFLDSFHKDLFVLQSVEGRDKRTEQYLVLVTVSGSRERIG